MQNEARDFYKEKRSRLNKEIEKLSKIINYLYASRLITFLLFGTFLVLMLQYPQKLLLISLALISIAAFLVAIKYDLKYRYRKKFTRYQRQICEEELEIMDYKYTERSPGAEYLALNPHLSADFDLFGKGSVFQFLNRCSTKPGTDLFATNLCQSELNTKIIKEKQDSIKELSGKIHFLHDYRTLGMFISESGAEIKGLKQWLSQTEKNIGRLQFFSYVIPLINISWIGLTIAGFFPVSALLFPVLFSYSIIFANQKRIGSAHDNLGKTTKSFEKYAGLIQRIEEEDFQTAYLQNAQKRLMSNNKTASKSLRQLFKLLNKFDIRYNIIASFLLNTMLIFDVQVLLRLVKWKKSHKNKIDLWFTSLAETDSMTSFATLAFNYKNEFAWPEAIDGSFLVDAREAGHPLIHPESRVDNNIHLEGRPAITIITGANMAGKSTFLRTISVNLLLAMNGAPVCAREMKYTPSNIMSSIKIQDSLVENESYFYAELLRLSEIIEQVKKQPQTLVVLDEILRGTNTRDKQAGSLGILEKFISLNATVMIATHDLKIGEMEQTYPGKVKNQCFEVELNGDQLVFDYKLKEGISQKLNASFLMKKMGIIEGD